MSSPIWPPDSDLPPADIDQRQVAEIFRSKGKAIVEAPPGTGKTFLGVYLALCACRLGWTCRDYQTLFLTFSRNARVQIEQEVRRFREEGWISGEEERAAKISNYHAFYFEILRRKAGIFGCPSPLRPASIAAREQRLNGLLSQPVQTSAQQLSFWEESATPASVPLKAAADNVLAQAKLVFALQRFGVQDLLGVEAESLLISEVQNRLYEDASQCLKEGRPHYDDFAPLFLNLLEWCPELIEWIRLAYPVIVLDEFQDTDLIQLEILRKIQPKHLVVLYDRYQMIYEWRGARRDRVDKIAQEFGFSTQTQAELTHIHRSDETGLKSFIQQLRKDDLRGAHVEAATSRPWLTLCPIKEPSTTIPSKNRCLVKLLYGGLVRSNQTTSILTRSNFLASFLYRNLLAPMPRKDGKQPRSYHCRRIGTASNPEEILRDLAWDLRSVDDDIALRRCFGKLLDLLVSERYSAKIVFADEFACTGDELLASRRREDLKKVRGELSPWWDSLQVGNYQIFPFALRKTLDIGELLLGQSRYLDPDLAYFIREISKSIESLTNEQEIVWPEFCDHLEDTIVRLTHLRMRQRPKGLYILTIHQSKGREFDHVIIPWLSSEGEPLEHGRAPLQHENFEDRRLLYVALTRARSHVTIVYPEEAPSPFITEWKLESGSK